MNLWQRFLNWLHHFGDHEPPHADPAVPAPVEPKQPITISRGWNPAWDAAIQAHLTTVMLGYENSYFGTPSTIEEMRVWWGKFLRAVCCTESSYDPRCVYVENFIDDTTGKLCRSVGLFQLSIGDANSYPDCTTVRSIKSDEQLFDPYFNIQCAMEIMQSLISNGRELSEYWSSVDPRKSGQETLRTLRSFK